MFINMKSNRLHKFLFSFLFLSIYIIPLFAKPKADEVYIKYVHPRTYEFDLCDTDKQIFLGYNKYEDRFLASVDFTRFIEKDKPQAGDKITFYYNGTATKNTDFVYAQLITDNHVVAGGESKKFCEDTPAKEVFQGQVSFVIKEDIVNDIAIKLYSFKTNTPGKIDQIYLRFNRVVETTDTVKEALAEQKAVRKNIEIVEVKTEVISDEEIAANAAEEEARKAAELAEAEAKKQAELQAQLEAQRLAQEQELLKQQEELEKALAAAKSNYSRYEKEYLNDFMVYDDPELDVEESESEEIIENPDEADSFGRTLLMKAAKAGNDWQIKTLLRSGAKVNLKDKDGWSALMYAVRYQESMTCVDLLIEAGAAVKTKNNYGSTPLAVAACYNNNPEVIKKLLSFYTTSDKEVLKSMVLLLSENHTSEYVQLAKLNIYLNLSVPLNTFYEGKTPLMYAAEFGDSTKVIQTLLDSNAITSIRSTEGKTAYEYAVTNKNLKHDSAYWALNKK